MHKRYGSNYSLWPEQAHPRRAIPLTTAVGGFAIGIVCAVAAYNVVIDFLRPVSIQRVARESAIAHVPINKSTAAPVTAADPVARFRRSVAKITLPTIGTLPITPSPDTDGRGTSGGNVLGDTSVAALTAPPATQPITSIEDPKSADKPSREPSSWKTKHAARERPAKVHKHRTVRKKRERPSMYASGYRNRPYFGYGGHVTYGWGGYSGGYGHAYGWSQW